MRFKTLGAALALASGFVLNASAWAADADRGAMLGNTCLGCHGPAGSSTGPATPSIAGFSQESLVDIMNQYKEDARPSTVMGRIAKGYTDEEVKAVAAFFAAQKMQYHEQAGVDAARAEKGAALHEKYCEKCHEDGGKIDDGSSVLAGQMKPYLEFSVADFQSGAREMPKKMKKKVDDLLENEGPDAMGDLVHFYASQK